MEVREKVIKELIAPFQNKEATQTICFPNGNKLVYALVRIGGRHGQLVFEKKGLKLSIGCQNASLEKLKLAKRQLEGKENITKIRILAEKGKKAQKALAKDLIEESENFYIFKGGKAFSKEEYEFIVVERKKVILTKPTYYNRYKNFGYNGSDIAGTYYKVKNNDYLSHTGNKDFYAALCYFIEVITKANLELIKDGSM